MALLSSYVRGGGNLIAFRPDKQLALVFRLSPKGTIRDGYIKIEPDNDIGKGLLSDTLQFHGDADRYEAKNADAVAMLYHNARTPAGNPAVVSCNIGSGHVIAFSYNLPKSIALTRQGNNHNAGLEKDGIEGIRAAEMFTDGWVDPSRNALNQADEQMRLLSHAIEKMASFTKPLPRFWYFPGLNKSLVLLTADGEDSPEEDFDAQLADIKSKGARMTLYLKGDYLPTPKVKQWISDGFEVSGHVDDTREATNPTYRQMDRKVNSTVQALKRVYGADMRTVRNHWIVWCGRDPDGTQDFTAQAAIEANHGIQMDCNYYHFDQNSTQGHFLGPIGNFNGSGLPMKFITDRGEVLDIYQALTQLPDEQWGRGNLFENFKLLLDRSLDREAYSFINVNLHTDRWRAWSRTEGLQIIDYANARQVPIWTAAQTLDFLQEREAAEFAGLDWTNNKLRFRVKRSHAAAGLTVMVPQQFGNKTIKDVLANNVPRLYTIESVKGSRYAFIPVRAQDNEFIVTYSKPPSTF